MKNFRTRVICALFSLSIMMLNWPLFAGESQEKSSLVTARILETTRVPDPDTSEYKDCLVAYKVEIIRLHSGDSVGEKCFVFFWGFKNRQLKEASTFKADQNLDLKLVPFELAPDKIQQVRQVYHFKDILDYDWYFCVKHRMFTKHG